ncbi:hypothetical protein AB0J52_26205 [Spirillospora sp. NPDC049652]
MRTRAVSRLGCAALVAVLAVGGVGGCGGGGQDAKKSEGDAQPVKLAPLPKVDPAQVKGLVGRWDGTGKDYFQFKADGSGVWKKEGQTLWSGLAIPDGRSKFRFSWQGGDPKGSNYWGATVSEDGKTMTFSGTGQTYTRTSGGKKSAGRTPGGKPDTPKGH